MKSTRTHLVDPGEDKSIFNYLHPIQYSIYLCIRFPIDSYLPHLIKLSGNCS